MGKFILAITLLLSIWGFSPPNTINGKWKVTGLKLTKSDQQLPPKKQAQVDAQIRKVFVGQVFDFRKDSLFFMTPGLPSMPRKLNWVYDSLTGRGQIKEINDPNSLILDFVTSEQEGNVAFTIRDAPIVLMMQKL